MTASNTTTSTRRPCLISSWQQIWLLIQIRPPNTITVTKVKGHASLDDVTKGKITADRREGNHNADECASQGLLLHGAEVVHFAQCATRRRKGYVHLMTTIANVIVNVLVAARTAHDQATRAHTCLLGHNPKTHVRSNGLLSWDHDPNHTFTIPLLPPIGTPHLMAHHQAWYLAIHQFLRDLQWAPTHTPT